MNSPQFHIQKEEQLKKINRIIQLAKHNHIDEKLKKTIIVNGEEAIRALSAERRLVYKALEDFGFNPQVYNHEDKIHFENVPVNVQDTRFIETEISNVVVAIIAESKKMAQEPIMNHQTNEKFVADEYFNKCTAVLQQALQNIQDEINAAQPVEVEAKMNQEELQKLSKTPEEEKAVYTPEKIEETDRKKKKK